MQTFLAYPDFIKSAKCLDYKRLGKQRVEALQIYLALTIEKSGWKNHPIVKMWTGYEQALLRCGMAICEEWKLRGYKDTLLDKFCDNYNIEKDVGNPSWLGNESFHASHRSNLLRKNLEHYKQFGWKESDNLPYIWFK